MSSSEPSPIILSSPDAGNRGAGEMLRRARESQGMSLEGLASMIKVTPGKLEALEQGRFEQLPDANFTRALAMTVCRALKVDPSDILAALPAARPTALAEGKPPLNQPFKDVRGGTPLFDHHFDWKTLLSVKWLAPLALLVGAVVIYALPDSVDVPGWFSRMARPSAPVAADAASAPVQVAPQPAELPGAQPSAPVGSEAPPVMAPPAEPASGSTTGVATPAPLVLDAADSAGSASAGTGAGAAARDPRLSTDLASAPSPASATGVPAGQLATSLSNTGTVALVVREPSWIEVRDAKGAKLLSRHVQAGETLSLDGMAPLYLRIGNAPGVQLSYKGQAVDLAPLTRNNVARVELK